MPEDSASSGGTSTTAGTPTSANPSTGGIPAGGKGIVPPGIVIPEETKAKYPDLVELILQSESMNLEERNYWLQVLPVMTPDQVQELRDILETEKKKLAAIDAKYTSADAEGPAVDPLEVERRRRAAREARQKEEMSHAQEDAQKQEALLAQLAGL